MNLPAIEPLNIHVVSIESSLNKPSAINEADFGSILKNELSNTEISIEKAEKLVQSLATGDAENLHQVMSAIQEAKLSFEMVVQIRNRLLEGYQEVMKMQV